MHKSLITFSPLFAGQAINELRRYEKTFSIQRAIRPGLLIAAHQSPFDALGRQWMARPSVYLHHAFPIDVELTFSQAADALTGLQAAFHQQIAPRLAPDQRIALQVRWLSTCSARADQHERTITIRPADTLVSILLNQRTDFALMGLSQLKAPMT